MPMIAKAEVETEHASRYLVELCQHLDDKAQARSDVPVRVEWSSTKGTADVGWGRCTMQATSSRLEVRAEAADRDPLGALCEFVTRHLEARGATEGLRVEWAGTGLRAVSRGDAGHRREAMREFHRRARPRP